MITTLALLPKLTGLPVTVSGPVVEIPPVDTLKPVKVPTLVIFVCAAVCNVPVRVAAVTPVLTLRLVRLPTLVI